MGFGKRNASRFFFAAATRKERGTVVTHRSCHGAKVRPHKKRREIPRSVAKCRIIQRHFAVPITFRTNGTTGGCRQPWRARQIGRADRGQGPPPVRAAIESFDWQAKAPRDTVCHEFPLVFFKRIGLPFAKQVITAQPTGSGSHRETSPLTRAPPASHCGLASDH